jgi:hypothetical protein
MTQRRFRTHHNIAEGKKEPTEKKVEGEGEGEGEGEQKQKHESKEEGKEEDVKGEREGEGEEGVVREGEGEKKSKLTPVCDLFSLILPLILWRKILLSSLLSFSLSSRFFSSNGESIGE